MRQLHPHTVLEGELTVAVAPDAALELFTPEGERRWVPGWSPNYPAGMPEEPVPGTVWTTENHGSPTTWIVLERTPDAMRYARVSSTTAGTVTVRCRPSSTEVDTSVRVRYELTALNDDGARELSAMSADYPSFLAGWEQAIRDSGADRGEEHAPY